jgi:hypothetical protein
MEQQAANSTMNTTPTGFLSGTLDVALNNDR